MDYVEPVPGPPLAVPRRREQPIGKSLIGIGPLVRQKGFDFCGRRRQTLTERLGAPSDR